MELLFSMLIFAALVVVYLAVRARIKRDQADGKPPGPVHGYGPKATPEAAWRAGTFLTANQHEQVYSWIAQGNLMKAAQMYRMFAGVTRSQAMDAVIAMAAHPQPYDGGL